MPQAGAARHGISVAILCVTIAHRVAKPASNRTVIRERAVVFRRCMPLDR
jgi:hypothetical protein